MKSVIVCCVLALAAVALARPKDNGSTYTDKYDSVDVPAILNNPRLSKAYFACLLDKGRCTPEGKELKARLGDALQNDCAKCTAIQRERSKQVISHLIKKEPKIWDQLKEKYDPTGIYSKKHEAELKAASQ